MAMGYYAKIIAIRLITICCLITILSSCRTIKFHTCKKIDCILNDLISEEDKKINIKDTTSTDSLTIRISYIDSFYVKRLIYNYQNIEKMLVYDNNLKLLSCHFSGIYNNSRIDIGKEYYFNKKGDLFRIIDTDKDYNVCWRQAICIGDTYSIKKKNIHQPNTGLEKSVYRGKKVWRYFYTNRKNKKKEIIIDGDKGNIVKILDVKIDY